MICDYVAQLHKPRHSPKVPKHYKLSTCRCAQVKPRELTNQQWRLKDKTAAPHMAAIVELCERRTHWVMTMICLHKKCKRNVIDFFIRVAKNLLKLHNMNAFSQV